MARHKDQKRIAGAHANFQELGESVFKSISCSRLVDQELNISWRDVPPCSDSRKAANVAASESA